MKVFNSTLAAIGLAAFVFASCSDSNSDPAGGSPAINPAEITNITLKSQTVDNSRVINYKNSTAKARKFFLSTRAEGGVTFPSLKAAPEEVNAKQLNNPADLEVVGKSYQITGQKSLNFAGKTTSNPQPIGFSGILLAKRQNSFYCTYFLHNRNVADTKSPYPIKRLEVIRWFNQKSMVFNQSLS